MINIEPELDICVKRIGGMKVTDLVGVSPPFLNADYLFTQYEVIAELKCLEEDKINDPIISKKASEIYARCVNAGKAPFITFGESIISTHDFPDEFKLAISELYRKPIESRIDKANKQIRQTKINLKKENHHGLLILANNGHTALHPSLAMSLISETFRRKPFESINSIIYFTANLRAYHPTIGEDIRVWIPTHRDPLNRCPEQLFSRLERAWLKRFAEITGEIVQEIHTGDETILHEISNNP